MDLRGACRARTHSELHLVLVQEGPRGSLRAPEEHSGLFAVHPERHVAANVKRCSVSFRAANESVIFFFFLPRRYRMAVPSGMLMTWSSVWSPALCRGGRQLLRDEPASALMVRKRFSDASPRPSTQSREPGLVPAKKKKKKKKNLSAHKGFFFLSYP